MMLFEDVENFTVRDVTLKDAAFWTLHMAGCQNVRIDGIKILNDDRGANNDGIDPGLLPQCGNCQLHCLNG